jgi:hypothetical protein
VSTGRARSPEAETPLRREGAGGDSNRPGEGNAFSRADAMFAAGNAAGGMYGGSWNVLTYGSGGGPGGGGVMFGGEGTLGHDYSSPTPSSMWKDHLNAALGNNTVTIYGTSSSFEVWEHGKDYKGPNDSESVFHHEYYYLKAVDEQSKDLKVFATGNHDDNFSQAMDYMNSQQGISYGFVLESGRIAVLPGNIYEYQEGKRTKKGYYLEIDGKWDKATKMLVAGFTSTWYKYPDDDLSRRIYFSKDREFRSMAEGLNVISLIYFHNPLEWDRSVTPYERTIKYSEIFIQKK